MKIKHILFFSLLLLACACSSDDSSSNGIEGDSGEKDAILTGTTWYYDDDWAYMSPFYSETDYNVQYAETDFLRSDYYNTVTSDTINITKTDSLQGTHYPSKIIFGNSKCQIIDSTFTKVQVRTYSEDYRRIRFTPGTYNLDYDTYVVTNDKLMSGGGTTTLAQLDNGVYYLPIEYNNYKQISYNEFKKDVSVETSTLDFTRTLYDIVLSKDNIKYNGKIDTDEGKLTLKQYSPSVGDEREYEIIK